MRVELDEVALVRVRAAREVVDRVLASGEAVYGLNTGLGSLARHRIPLQEIGEFSFRTVADQVSSYGRPLATDVVRAMIVSRVNGMLKAGVGVTRELIELLVALLNAGVHPIVRMVGSVGQGDLSEMADIGKVVIGRGWAEYGGEVMRGEEALEMAGLAPLSLGPKEALGLIASNGVTMGRGNNAAAVLLTLAALAARREGAGLARRARRNRRRLPRPRCHGRGRLPLAGNRHPPTAPICATTPMPSARAPSLQ